MPSDSDWDIELSLRSTKERKKDRGLDDLIKRVIFFHSLLDVVKLD